MPNVYAQALRRVVQIYGAEVVAKRLGVSDTQMSTWLQGHSVPGERVFLEIVDILTEHGINEITQSPSAQPPKDAG